jgi:DNA modification methylase
MTLEQAEQSTYINRFIVGDSRTAIKERIPASGAHGFFTSPPYFGKQRQYTDGDKAEIGRTNDVDRYLDDLIAVARGGMEVMPDWAVQVWNIGDKFEDKVLLRIPDKFATRMEKDLGYFTFSEVCWFKGNGNPRSETTHFKPDFEKVLFFARSKEYFFDVKANRVPIAEVTERRYEYEVGTLVAMDSGMNSRHSPGKVMLKSKKKPKFGGFKHAGNNGSNVYSGHEYDDSSQLRVMGAVWMISPQLERFDKEYCPTCDALRAEQELWHRCNKCHIARIDKDEDGNYEDCIVCKCQTNHELMCAVCDKRTHEHYACVTPDTEILTDDGWKQYKELKPGELVATYNLKKQKIEYQNLEYVKEYDFDGELIHVGNNILDIAMTPNHRNVALVRGFKYRHTERIVLAEDLRSNHSIRVLAPVEYASELSLGESKAELIGWIIAEGTYVCKDKKWRSIDIFQNEGEKAARIDQLLAEIGIPHSRIKSLRIHKRDRKVREQVSWHLPRSEFTEWMYKNVPDKKLNRLLVSLPQNELRAMLSGLIEGDGHTRKDGRMAFIQADKKTVEWFEILAMRCGYHTNTCYRNDTLHPTWSTYAVHLSKKTHISIRATNNKGTTKSRLPYKGKIWCPKTPNGTWVAKRNGKVFITGNTFPVELARRVIKSCCPEYVCSQCFKPYMPTYAETRISTRPGNDTNKGKSGTNADPQAGLHNSDWSKYRQTAIHTPTGWQKPCSCEAKWEPGLMIDPFMGFGTTAFGALELGRRFTGFDLVKNNARVGELRVAPLLNKGSRIDFF